MQGIKKVIITTKMKFYLALLMVVSILATSCSKKEPCTNDGIPSVSDVPQETIDKVPYKDFSELTFIDSASGDTHVFIGQGWKKSYWFYKDWEMECNDGVNCQKIIQQFYSSTYPHFIQIGMVMTDPSIDFIEVAFNNNFYYLWPSIRSPYSYDSLLIAGKYRFKIEYFKNDYKSPNNTVGNCLYNISEGLLKIVKPPITLELLSVKL